eukprot:2318229-Rhodomonas_salina.2
MEDMRLVPSLSSIASDVSSGTITLLKVCDLPLRERLVTPKAEAPIRLQSVGLMVDHRAGCGGERRLPDKH